MTKVAEVKEVKKEKGSKGSKGINAVKDWVENSGYSAALGVQAKAISDEAATLYLPFKEANSNPGGALHGGVYASMSVIAAHAIARTTLGEDAGHLHTAGLQINYLAAAINEGVTAEAKLLRRGKELCFIEVTCISDAGEPVSQCSLMIRARMDQDEPELPALSAPVKGDAPGAVGALLTGTVQFIRNRGIKIEHLLKAQARLIMPWKEGHGNGSETDGTHEGAALALLDTAGSMASWAKIGFDHHKASTPAFQAQVIGPIPKGELVAHATVRHHDNELFYTDVEVAGVDDGKVCVRGTVIYRIVQKK